MKICILVPKRKPNLCLAQEAARHTDTHAVMPESALLRAIYLDVVGPSRSVTVCVPFSFLRRPEISIQNNREPLWIAELRVLAMEIRSKLKFPLEENREDV